MLVNIKYDDFLIDIIKQNIYLFAFLPSVQLRNVKNVKKFEITPLKKLVHNLVNKYQI